MSDIESKRNRERFLMDHFIRVAELPVRVVGSPDPPDFVVQFEGRKVGVELTDIYQDSLVGVPSLQARESISESIVAMARNVYEGDADARPVNVQLVFSPGHELRSVRRDEAAQQVAAFVAKHPVGVFQAATFRIEQFDGELPESIAYVRVFGVPTREMSHWSVASAGWAASLTASMLEERIRAKAKLLPRYREVVKENWLVLVCEGKGPSQFFDSASIETLEGVSSPFDRTYFYEHFMQRVVRLC